MNPTRSCEPTKIKFPLKMDSPTPPRRLCSDISSLVPGSPRLTKIAKTNHGLSTRQRGMDIHGPHARTERAGAASAGDFNKYRNGVSDPLPFNRRPAWVIGGGGRCGFCSYETPFQLMRSWGDDVGRSALASPDRPIRWPRCVFRSRRCAGRAADDDWWTSGPVRPPRRYGTRSVSRIDRYQ